MLMNEKGLLNALICRDPHEKEAVEALRKLRQGTEELIRLYMRNEVAARGHDSSCPFAPDELRQRLEVHRDAAMQQRFREELTGLLAALYGREPTPEELAVGVPASVGLGDVPLPAGNAATVAGSAQNLLSITRYLSDLERTVHGGDARPSLAWRAIKGAIVLGAVAGGSYAAWRGYHWAHARWETRQEKTEELGAKLEERMEPEEVDDLEEELKEEPKEEPEEEPEGALVGGEEE